MADVLSQSEIDALLSALSTGELEPEQVSKEEDKHKVKIYDFRNSGKKDFVPDIELIKKLDREFCEPRKNQRPLI